MALEAPIKKCYPSIPKSYAAPPEAYEEYRASLKKWYEGLSDEAKMALKIQRRRTHGTGFALYGFSAYLSVFLTIVSTYRSETFREAE